MTLKIAIAVGLPSPKVFLFDEPLPSPDTALRGRTRVEIAGLRCELGAPLDLRDRPASQDVPPVSRWSDRTPLNPGNGVCIETDAKTLHCFDGQGRALRKLRAAS